MTEAGKNVLSLYDRNRRPIMQLFVLPSNTKDDKYSPVNIQQKILSWDNCVHNFYLVSALMLPDMLSQSSHSLYIHNIPACLRLK